MNPDTVSEISLTAICIADESCIDSVPYRTNRRANHVQLHTSNLNGSFTISCFVEEIYVSVYHAFTPLAQNHLRIHRPSCCLASSYRDCRKSSSAKHREYRAVLCHIIRSRGYGQPDRRCNGCSSGCYDERRQRERRHWLREPVPSCAEMEIDTTSSLYSQKVSVPASR